MDREQIKIAQNAIENIARRDGVTVDYVREEIMAAILSSYYSSDPKVKVFWDTFSGTGQIPTPEEFILRMSKLIKK